MKKQMWTRFFCAGIVLSLSLGLLTGCREKTVDYSIDGATEDTQMANGKGKSGVAQFADAGTWNETWTIDKEDGETLEIVIDADVVVPATEQMSVVEVRVPGMDAEYKEKIAKRIFKNEAVYYNDTAHLPKKELEEIRAFYEAESLNGEGGNWLEKELEKYEALIETAKDTYTPVDEYTVDEYIGERDGIHYSLRFTGGETSTEKETLWYWEGFYLNLEDCHEVCPEEVRDIEDLLCREYPYTSVLENGCKLSEEEAKKQAKQFIADLGLEYPVLADTKPLMWGEAGSEPYGETFENWIANGYVFTFEYGMDDVSFVHFGKESDYYNYMDDALEGGGRRYSMEATVKVYVTNKGVIELDVESPIETTGVSEKVELLPLDTIQGIMKEKITTQRGIFKFDYLPRGTIAEFNSMELIYFRMRDKEKEGYYSYVPAWRLSDQAEYEDMKIIENPVIINAIDGSVIDFYEET